MSAFNQQEASRFCSKPIPVQKASRHSQARALYQNVKKIVAQRSGGRSSSRKDSLQSPHSMLGRSIWPSGKRAALLLFTSNGTRVGKHLSVC